VHVHASDDLLWSSLGFQHVDATRKEEVNQLCDIKSRAAPTSCYVLTAVNHEGEIFSVIFPAIRLSFLMSDV